MAPLPYPPSSKVEMFINKIIPAVINSFTQHDLHKKIRCQASIMLQNAQFD